MRSSLFCNLSVVALLFLSACDTADVQEDLLRSNLNAPTLLQPASSQTMPASIAFEWTPVEKAFRYELELSSDLLTEERMVTTVAPIHHATLETAGEYAWRVRAVDARGRVGYWSKRHHLTVVPR
jgi:hypothetical protein